MLSRHRLKGDLYGGITAAIVALPLALAFGVSSGAGPIAGVYGAICVGLFAAIFGGTPTQISGPTGPMTVVMATVLTDFIAQDPEHGLATAFTVVMLAGICQMGFGLLRLGKYFTLVPYPVISGFMSGIGVIIILLELPPLFGMPGEASVIASLQVLTGLTEQGVVGSAVLGGLSIALLISWPERFNRILPAPLVVLLLGTVILVLLLKDPSVPVIGAIPRGLPSVQGPHWSLHLLGEMVYAAILLASLGSIDSLLTSLVADNITKTHHDSDRELIGQGIGNVAAGLFGGLPGAGATMRTVVNIRAGGSTPLSGIVHAMLLLFIIIFAGRFAEHIPLAVLAGILIKVGIDIIDWNFLRRLHRLPAFSIGLMLGVLILTVFVDLITAVLIGVFIANLVTIDRLSNLQLDNLSFMTGADSGTQTDSEGRMLAELNGRVLLIRLQGPMSFGVARDMRRRITEYPDQTVLILDLSEANLVGITTTIAIEEIMLEAVREGKTVLLVGVNETNLASLKRLHVFEHISDAFICKSRVDALFHAQELLSDASSTS